MADCGCRATELGRKLEEKFWSEVKEHDTYAIKHRIAEIFQGTRLLPSSLVASVLNRSEEIDLLRDLDLQDFHIYNLIGKLSDDGKVLTVGYTFVANGILTNQNFYVNNQAVSVWKKTGRGWQWVSHATYGAF